MNLDEFTKAELQILIHSLDYYLDVYTGIHYPHAEQDLLLKLQCKMEELEKEEKKNG